MSNENIYTPIFFSPEDAILPPTYLYIKQHSVTKLKYYGKTTQDPCKYNGSGTYWKNHLKVHNKQFVETLWVS